MLLSSDEQTQRKTKLQKSTSENQSRTPAEAYSREPKPSAIGKAVKGRAETAGDRRLIKIYEGS